MSHYATVAVPTFKDERYFSIFFFPPRKGDLTFPLETICMQCQILLEKTQKKKTRKFYPACVESSWELFPKEMTPIKCEVLFWE